MTYYILHLLLVNEVDSMYNKLLEPLSRGDNHRQMPGLRNSAAWNWIEEPLHGLHARLRRPEY
jgi:hypothetical protein